MLSAPRQAGSVFLLPITGAAGGGGFGDIAHLPTFSIGAAGGGLGDIAHQQRLDALATAATQQQQMQQIQQMQQRQQQGTQYPAGSSFGENPHGFVIPPSPNLGPFGSLSTTAPGQLFQGRTPGTSLAEQGSTQHEQPAEVLPKWMQQQVQVQQQVWLQNLQQLQQLQQLEQLKQLQQLQQLQRLQQLEQLRQLQQQQQLLLLLPPRPTAAEATAGDAVTAATAGATAVATTTT